MGLFNAKIVHNLCSIRYCELAGPPNFAKGYHHGKLKDKHTHPYILSAVCACCSFGRDEGEKEARQYDGRRRVEVWEERAEGRERGGGPGWQGGHGGGFGGRGGGGRGRDEDSLRGYRDHRLILSGL